MSVAHPFSRFFAATKSLESTRKLPHISPHCSGSAMWFESRFRSVRPPYFLTRSCSHAHCCCSLPGRYRVDRISPRRTRRAQTHSGMLLRIRTYALLLFRALLLQRRSDVSTTCPPLQNRAMRPFIVGVRKEPCISMKLESRGEKKSSPDLL